MEKIETTILSVISEEIGQHHWLRKNVGVTTDASLQDLLCDSLGRVSIACALDTRFGIELKDETIASWVFVGDIIASVCRKYQPAQQG